jgi:hypothetical protein
MSRSLSRSIFYDDTKDTFIEWLRHSQDVTKLENCEKEHSIMSAFSGKSSVPSLSLLKCISTYEYSDFHILSLARALQPGH